MAEEKEKEQMLYRAIKNVRKYKSQFKILRKSHFKELEKARQQAREELLNEILELGNRIDRPIIVKFAVIMNRLKELRYSKN